MAELWNWIKRYIKFALIGLPIFLLSTAVYSILFYFLNLGIWAYLISSISGGIAQFILVGYCNKTKFGKMFGN